MSKETIEDFIEREGYNEGRTHDIWEEGVREGAVWQAERMYSEEEKFMKFLDTEKMLRLSDTKTIERIKWYFETYLSQNKKQKP